MKKILSLALVLVLVLSLAACGGASAKSTVEPAAGSAAASTGSETTEPATGGIAKEDLKIGVLHILDPSDQGYTYNHDMGTKYMCEHLGIDYDTQVVNKFNIDDQDPAATQAALKEMIQAGCQIIFATSFSYGSQVVEIAMENPDVQFCHAAGFDAHDADLPNLHNYFAKIHEARYLAGIAAGMKATEIGNNKLGYVAAYPYAEVISGFSAFYLGAQSVNPDVTMDVIYIMSWGDAIKEAEVAQTLIDGGCGVISQHSDNVAPATIAEKNGAFHVGYNNDMVPAAPKASLLSARINWGIYMTYAVDSMINGTPIAVDWSEGIESGAAYLSDLNTAIAAEGTQEAIDAATKEIEGGLMIFSGHLLTPDGKDAEITNFDGDVIYTFDADSSNFAESDEKSAPAFNAIIKGINVID